MWTLNKTSYKEQDILVNESLFALGNGYLGVRGCFEEQSSPSIRGTYINGFYDTTPLSYSEKLYGFPDDSERQVNVIEAQTVEIYLDGEKVSLTIDNVLDFEQTLDLKQGISIRKYTYLTTHQKKATLCFKRLVSFKYEYLFLMDINIEYDGFIEMKSFLEGDLYTYADETDPRVGSHKEQVLNIEDMGYDDHYQWIEARTLNSDLTIKTVSTYQTSVPVTSKIIDSNVISMMSGMNKLQTTKYTAYLSSLKDYNNSNLKAVESFSFEEHMRFQKSYLDLFWDASDIEILGDEALQQGIRFNLFQLLQSVGKDGKTNIGAKGLTGEGYEGHTFWDTEIYILPCLLMSQPELSKKLLMYRYDQLEESRERARVLGHKRGVKFPWRTITGKESSSYFPAGTAQYHINGDVSYSIIQYYLMTDDLEFMKDYGFEILVETSLLWLEIGHFYKESFRIDAVTGPDEYSCVVNNNYYTNLIAKYNMHWTYMMKDILENYNPEAYKQLIEKIKISEDDFDNFRKAEEQMYLPYDETLNINLQDDHFLEKKLWDFDNTPKEKYPLLLHFHPLTIYRHQVLKQADTVLAHLLLEEYVHESIRRDSFHYYEQLTTHDSSLSSCIYGMMASKLGEYKHAVDYFNETIFLDLKNTHKNTKDGLHMANLGGSILAILKGFAGFRITIDGVELAPWIPDEWESVKFKIRVKTSWIEVRIAKDIQITLLEGDTLSVSVYGDSYELENSLRIRRQYD